MIYERKHQKIQDNRYKRRDWIIDALCVGAILIVGIALYIATKGI